MSDENTEFNLPIPEIDVISFEMDQRKYLYELQMKRIQLDEYRRDLNKAITKQHELEWQLANEKRRNLNDCAQNAFTASLSKKLEKEQDRMRQEIAHAKMQLELIVTERNSLKQQMQTLHGENFKLRQQLDELQNENQCHQIYQNDLQTQKAEIETSIKQLQVVMQLVKNSHEDAMKIKDSIEHTTQMQYAIKELQVKYDQVNKQKEQIQNQLILKSVELDKLKELFDNSQFEVNENEEKSIIQYWKITAEHFQNKWLKEQQIIEELTQMLQSSNESNKCLVETTEKLMKEIDELKNGDDAKETEVENKEITL